MKKGESTGRGATYSNILWSILCFIVFALAVLLVCPFGVWPFELMQSFSVQFAWICGVVLLWSLFTRNVWAIASSTGALAFMATSISYYVVDYRSEPLSSQVRISVVNIFHFNQEHDKLLPMLHTLESDFLSILELGDVMDLKMRNELTATHPYSISVPSPECCYGMAFYSKLPILEDSVYYWTQDPVIRARVVSLGKEVDVWSVHTRPPIFPNDTEERNFLMAKVAEEIRTIGKPALLAGDLNIVPWAEDFKEMKTTSGMTDSRRGFLATYPMELGIPLIPIDHIMHTEHFTTAFCKTEVIPGSDHKALVAGLNWK